MEVYNYYVTNSFYTFSNMPMTENEAKILVEYGLKIAGFIVTALELLIHIEKKVPLEVPSN